MTVGAWLALHALGVCRGLEDSKDVMEYQGDRCTQAMPDTETPQPQEPHYPSSQEYAVNDMGIPDLM